MNINKVSSSGMVPNQGPKPENADRPEKKDEDQTNTRQLQAAMDTLNDKAAKENYNVRFAVYKDTHRIIVEVVDKSNDQVISTFPPRQILEMARMVDKEFRVLDKKI